jgi:hypothetical protein
LRTLLAVNSSFNAVVGFLKELFVILAGWTTYYFDDAPVFNGFNAGISRTNTTIYLARGYMGGQFIPGVFMNITSS